MSEWKEVQLNEICNLIAGYAFKSKDFGNYPTKVLKIADINPPFVSSEKSSGVDLSNYDVDKLEKYIVKKGDYILAMTGATIGKLGRYVSDEHAYLNQRVLKFQPYQSIDSNFLYYVLCGRLFAKYIINHIDSESAQPNISAGTIGKYRFNLPDFKTQQEIASILSSLDSKIENNRKICANLEAQAQALFKHWFIDFAPFKEGKFVESELGMIPEGWRVGKLGEIADITMGQSPSGSSYNEEGNGSIFYQGRSEFGFRFPSIRLFTTEPKRYAEPLSTLLSVRAPVGDINVATVECCIGRGLASIKSKYNHHSFIYYLLMSMKRTFDVYNGEGTVFECINNDTLNGISIVVPPVSVVKAFNDIVEELDCMILESHNENLRLIMLRDTLLPKLMSGAIKV